MSNDNKIALAMIVAPEDEEADYLADCLESVRPHVDGAFISITGENENVQQVCDFYDCETQNIEWNDHFAEARNKSFEFVDDEYDYILWLDADDILENGSEIKNLISQHPADAYQMWYLYSLDENDDPIAVHKKTQIVKNDGTFKWEGRLHEGLYTERQIESYLIEDIRRVHMSTEDRFEEAKERNVRVAEKQVENKPDDPRSYWNLANSQKSYGQWEEALDTFDTFIEKSESEAEKYLAHVRKGEIMDALDKPEAEKEYRMAIGMEPEYPDAYIGLGKFMYHNERYTEAKDMLKAGLRKEPPYQKLLVYNPREYDYEPMRYLALTCVQLNMMNAAYELFQECAKLKPNDENLQQLIEDFEEKSQQEEEVEELIDELSEIEDDDELKERLEEIPHELRSHPFVCKLVNNRFVKEESSGKDIVYFCGDSAEEWTPKTAQEEGIGGSEEAVINLTQQWAEDGWNVTVYNKCGHEVQEFGDVTYKPYWMVNNQDKQDVVILWRLPAFAETEFNADKVFLDMHDALPEAEFTQDRLDNIDKIFVKSEFHRSLYPNVPDEKFVIAPNGINPEKFDPETEKEDKLLINTSSPDRSISALIKGFQKVKEEVPDAKLKWAYGWNVFDNSNPSDRKRQWKETMQEAIEEVDGFEALGRISHEEVAELYNEGEIFAYPTEFAEIDCYEAGTRVLTGSGYKNIEDLSLDDKVITHKGNLKRIKGLMAKKHESVVDVEVYCGDNFSLSPEHPLWVERDGERDWIKAGNLEHKDLLLTPRHLDFPKMEFVEPIFKERANNLPTQEHDLPDKIEIDEDVAWFLGYFAGDGTAHPMNGQTKILVADKHDNILEKVTRIITEKFGLPYNIRQEQGCKNVVVSSYPLARWFREHFYTDGDKEIPMGLHGYSETLDGLIDADGSCYNGYNWSFSNTSLSLIGFVQSALATHRGIACKVQTREHKSGSKSYYMSWTQTGTHQFYDVGDDYIKRKVKTTEEREIDDYLYNMEVADDNTFIANGFATHNCISITKAMAAGAVPVTTDFSALGEKTEYGGTFLESDKTKDTWQDDGQIDFALDHDRIDEWAEAVIEQLKEPDEIDSEQVKEDYAWENIAQRWEEEF